MLARAVAAQAGVDFFAASGSSFVEMFVGRGAARIRRLFKEARKSGRAVIFIDELDAVGGHRGSGGGDGGTSEREQALNQLLVELDGFERDPGTVIVIAASNYVEKLDKALLRPGRFDRQVLVAPPDRDGREAILRSHAKGKPLGRRPRPHRRRPQDDRDDRRPARQRAQRGGDHRRARRPRGDRPRGPRRGAAAPVGRLPAGAPPDREGAPDRRLPRGRPRALPPAAAASTRRRSSASSPAGRRSASSPTRRSEDRYLRSRKQLLDEIVTLLGGRAAEEEVFGEAYSGAADDLARVQHDLHADGHRVRDGRRASARPTSAPLALPTGDYALSDRTRRDVDANAAMTLARDGLRARPRADAAPTAAASTTSPANALERETLTREDLDEIFAAHELRRTFLPEDEESEARKLIAKDRSRSTGALMPQHIKPDEPKKNSE